MEDSISPSRPRGPVLVVLASVVGALVVGAAVGVVVTKKLNSSGAPVVTAPEVPVDAGQVPTTPSVPAVDTPPLAAKENLEVEWTTAPIDISDATITEALGIEYGAITPKEKDSYVTFAFKKIGTIKGGTRDGDMVLLASIPCDGMCTWPIAARLIVDSRARKILALTTYGFSKEYLKNFTGALDGIELRPASSLVPIYAYLQDAQDITLQGMEMPKQVSFKGGTHILVQPAYSDVEQFNLITTIDAKPFTSTADGRQVYQSKDRSCLYLLRPDHSYARYELVMPFMKDGKIPQITWTDKTLNTVDYIFTDAGGCGARNCYATRPASEVKKDERLVQAGMTSNNEPIYTIKNIQDPELKAFYETNKYYNKPDGSQGTYTIEEMLAARPIFYWQDPFGQWVRFTSMKFAPMAECGKPVVYLYPEKNTDVRVSVGLKGEMTKSEPEHGKTGWSVVAQPDGYVINKADGKTYPNLFWEGTGVDYKTPTQGFVIKGAETDAWLTKTLAIIGFTERESAEFREFWVPRMPKTPYVFVTFVSQAYFDRDAPLRITPRPDHVFRVFMEYRGLDAPASVEPLTLPKITRDGFTVVEWGGALRK